MPRALIFADTHTDFHGTALYPVPGSPNSRWMWSLRALGLLAEAAAAHECCAALGCGDYVLQIGSQYSQVVTELKKAMERIGEMCLPHGANLIGGNHDETGGGEFHSLVEVFASGHVDAFPEPVVTLPIEGMRFILLPWCDDPDVYFSHLESLGVQTKGKPAVLISHVGIIGSRIGHEQYDPKYGFKWPTEIWKKFPNVKAAFFGHYHPHQDISHLVGIPAWYVGSPLQHGFGDAGDGRGYMVMEWDGGNVHAKFHPLTGLPRFYKVQLETEEDAVEFLMQEHDPLGYYRIVLYGPARLQHQQISRMQIGLHRTVTGVRSAKTAQSETNPILKLDVSPAKRLRTYLESKGYAGEELTALLKIGLGYWSKAKEK